MADIEQKNQTSSETPEELARRLRSLLEEPWSPAPPPAEVTEYEHLEREPVQEDAPEAPAPQPEEKPEGFLKKYRKQRPQREKPSWYQPPREKKENDSPAEELLPSPDEQAPQPAQDQADQEQPASAEASTSVDAPAPSDVTADASTAAEPLPAPDAVPQTRANGALLVLRDLVSILAVLTLVFTFAFRISRVEGSSMYPSLVNGDQMILTGSLLYREPQRGDVVAARIPGFSRDPIVKRVIAVEGDTVDIDFEAGTVSVNGRILEEPYINAPTHRSFGDQGTEFPLTVEKDHVFLLGDNRNDSYDSRYASIGQVDVRCILGRASALLWPGWDEIREKLDLSRIGLIG